MVFQVAHNARQYDLLGTLFLYRQVYVYISLSFDPYSFADDISEVYANSLLAT